MSNGHEITYELLSMTSQMLQDHSDYKSTDLARVLLDS